MYEGQGRAVGTGDQGDRILVNAYLGTIERANRDHAYLSSSLGGESHFTSRASQEEITTELTGHSVSRLIGRE
jgi:hypothetical protein